METIHKSVRVKTRIISFPHHAILYHIHEFAVDYLKLLFQNLCMLLTNVSTFFFNSGKSDVNKNVEITCVIISIKMIAPLKKTNVYPFLSQYHNNILTLVRTHSNDAGTIKNVLINCLY